ncbi:Gfo/Idh/MocA family protein [Crateriforma conspicua]|uniref:Inositol 2-dehydrogenase n=1 Tax=Crateriforma conspicua TaxID=2527996 RepID=A0A5C5YB34_9PLAN|nr:Gfo/Idh/MocA family oxidoreductase [Crateriforma conspicua]TWT72344.1 Inositol 2-dehydrogenase [Crateriforma conspicua]
MKNDSSHLRTNRRQFTKTSAGLLAAGTAALAFPKRAMANANSKMRIGFVGVGGRGFGAHVKSLTKLAKEGAPIELVAVCDVYSVNREKAAKYIQSNLGNQPAQHVDFRDMYAKENLDAVCIGTPDHWHAKQAIEAMQAGMNVYCEKPMVKKVEEAIDLVKVWRKTGVVMQVGVQSTSLPVWDHANRLIRAGQLGKVLMYQTEYFRNSDLGQWRYYELTKEMNPSNIDWRRFLGVDDGLSEEVPFDRAVYRQWRRFWPFGSGMFTDLFVHRTTTMLKATGLRYPARVTGSGGIYLEYDGRDVPDVSTVVAEFNEGVQGLVTATMASSETPIKQVIRGHHGSFVFGNQEDFDQFTFVPERPQVTHISPKEVPYEPQIIRPDQRMPENKNHAHFQNWIDAMVADDPQLCNNTPDLGAAAIVIVNLGARSYRQGKVYRFDGDEMAVSEADGSWAKRWEDRSHQRGKPEHIPGWEAGDTGSKIFDPDYQKLEGPWIDGKDPAGV